MRPVDKLLGGYLAFLTLVIIARGGLTNPTFWWLLAMHGLIAAVFYLFSRLQPNDRIGQVIHDLYPLVLLPVLYSELGVMTLELGTAGVYAHDAMVQGWEASIFGGQPSYDWIRNAPSVFWSGLLHLAYLGYYPIIVVGPVALIAVGRREDGRRVLLATMLAFVVCYVVFALFPVAGPNYAFEHPTGAVREVWSARLVYSLLSSGSAFGTAFPSSHVAATVAATVALWYVWRNMALAVLIPTILLIVATVYCQMHYVMDAGIGLVLGVVAGVVGARGFTFGQPAAKQHTA